MTGRFAYQQNIQLYILYRSHRPYYKSAGYVAGENVFHMRCTACFLREKFDGRKFKFEKLDYKRQILVNGWRII